MCVYVCICCVYMPILGHLLETMNTVISCTHNDYLLVNTLRAHMCMCMYVCVCMYV